MQPTKSYILSKRTEQLQKKLLDAFAPDLYESLILPDLYQDNSNSDSNSDTESENLLDYYKNKHVQKR